MIASDIFYLFIFHFQMLNKFASQNKCS